MRVRLVRCFAFVLLALFSLASLCKKPEDEENYLEPVNVSNNPSRSENPSIAVDSKGTVHLVWNDDTPGNEEILYAFKPKDGSWSAPVNISNNSQASRFPQIVVDKNDVLHLAWQDCSPYIYPHPPWRIFYTWKEPNSNWAIPETIGGNWDYFIPHLTVDNYDNVHLIWTYGGYYQGIRYAMRSPETGWSEMTDILPYPNLPFEITITVTPSFDVHVAWSQDVSDTAGFIFYSTKPKDGNWTEPARISSTGNVLGGYPRALADKKGDVHFTWHEGIVSEHGDIAYRVRYADGSWSEVEPCTSIAANCACPITAPFLGPDDVLNLIWQLNFKGDTAASLCYSRRIPGDWEKRTVLTKCSGGYSIFTATADYEGNIHIAFTGCGEKCDIFYLEKRRE